MTLEAQRIPASAKIGCLFLYLLMWFAASCLIYAGVHRDEHHLGSAFMEDQRSSHGFFSFFMGAAWPVTVPLSLMYGGYRGFQIPWTEDPQP